jgi:YVTN family beta-propeller protein
VRAVCLRAWREAALLATTGAIACVALAQPAAVAAAPSRPIFVLNSQDADVSLIDPATHAVLQRIPTGKEPHHLYLTPDEKSVIVANAASNSLTFLDPRTGAVQRTVRDIVDPYHLRFSPDMKWFVTAANRLNHVDIYRWQPDQPVPLKLARRIEAPKTPSHLSIDSRSSVVYASLQDSDELLAIDLGTLAPRWKIKVGSTPADIFLTPDDRTLLVALTGDRAVEAWDVAGSTPKLIKRIPTGAGAHAFRARGDKRHVFVSNRVANTISLIDTQSLSVVAEFAAPGGPDCMDVTADGKTLLVTSRWARKLTYIDIGSRQIVRQVAVGRSPHGVWTLDHAPRQ